MSAILYLIICFCTGYVICTYAVPNMGSITNTTYRNNHININQRFLTFPVYFITGTILVTWTTYILAVLFQNKEQPLIFANVISLSIFLIFSVVGIYFKKFRIKDTKKSNAQFTLKDCIFVVLVAFLTIHLMWTTVHASNGHLYIGYTVFSDFSPHIGMIRSFSASKNFPTTYSHFAGADIRYHFMFQFLVGNLEFLGLRIDWAINLPSIIGFMSSFFLLFVLAVKLSGKRAVGYLSCLFFAFRSSKSLFAFLAQVPKGTNIFKALYDNRTFLATTPNEDWGLWNLNVYCNQRHLAFTIPMMLFVIILFLPTVYESIEKLVQKLEELHKKRSLTRFDLKKSKLETVIVHCFFTKDAWKVQNLSLAVFSGILIGTLAFWNGAVTIAILLVLFVMAVVANRKLEYLITACISVILSFIQTSVFIQGESVSPKFEFGFIAENKTLFGVIDYILRLTGILPFVLLIAFLVMKGTRRYVMIAFSAPFIFSFCISLTTDVTVNHKYIMLSIMLLSIFAAILIVKLFSVKKILIRFFTVITVLLLTVSGFYDYITVIRKNQEAIDLNLESELTKWIINNCDSDDIILSSNYSLNQVVLGGGMLFLGWPYYGWSAGYDTDGRAQLVREMFEANTSEKLDALAKDNNIRYIIVDKDCRDSVDYTVNEYNIATTYETVYEEGSDEWKISIYDTKRLRYE